jgi:nucleoside-diphosphate-sugar epimerase
MLTGATGFVGRHTLSALAQAGHEVHAVARRRGPTEAGVIWHEADLLAGCELVGEVRPEILVHLAWYARHGEFWSSPENLRWVEASLALLRAFVAANGRRAVVAGTCAEYEWSCDVYPESALTRPATLYGAAKHGLHVIASAYAKKADFSLAWGRLFFLYGPFEAPERFVPSLVLPLLRREPAAMTTGSQRRDFLHVADAGAAFAALADSPVEGPVNVASGSAVAIRELGEQIAEQLDAGELLQIGARPTPAGEPADLVADVRRLRDEVGWSPEIGLVDGLAGAITWWRERLSFDPEDHARRKDAAREA